MLWEWLTREFSWWLQHSLSLILFRCNQHTTPSPDNNDISSRTSESLKFPLKPNSQLTGRTEELEHTLAMGSWWWYDNLYKRGIRQKSVFPTISLFKTSPFPHYTPQICSKRKMSWGLTIYLSMGFDSRLKSQYWNPSRLLASLIYF